jgi:hypothetical protein
VSDATYAAIRARLEAATPLPARNRRLVDLLLVWFGADAHSNALRERAAALDAAARYETVRAGAPPG